MIGSRLTELQEIVEDDSNGVDLAVGYPRVLDFRSQASIFAKLLQGSDFGSRSAKEVLATLKETVRTTLQVPAEVRVELTFSGSVALERVIRTQYEQGSILVTVPGFDVIQGLAAGIPASKPRYVEINPFASSAAAAAQIIEGIDHTVGSVVLVSPDNPSGIFFTEEQMHSIADKCATCGTLLIVDHCFFLINPASGAVGSAFTLGRRCRWISLWDSSKTLELMGEKLGFILGPEAELSSVRQALSEIQLDLPVATAGVLDACLRDGLYNPKPTQLGTLILENYRYLQQHCHNLGFTINDFHSGSFAIMKADSGPYADATVLANALRDRFAIYVVPSRLMYPPGYDACRDFIRVSLARPRDSIVRFCDSLRALVDRS